MEAMYDRLVEVEEQAHFSKGLEERVELLEFQVSIVLALYCTVIKT
jgi:hypothetical protein